MQPMRPRAAQLRRAGFVYLPPERSFAVRVALAQIGSVPGAFAQTVERMLHVAEQAQRAGADLVVYPATALTGAYPMGLAEQRSFQLDLLAAIEDFALRTPVAAAVPAYVCDSAGGYTEVFLCNDQTACPLRRREANGPDSAYAGAYEAPAVCTANDVSMRFLAGDAVLPGELECDLAFSLAPVPYCFDDVSALGVYGAAGGLLAALADGAPCALAVVQGVGAYDDVVFAGGSFAATPDGAVVAVCPLFEEGLAVFDATAAGEDGPEAFEVAPVGQPGAPVGSHLSELGLFSDDERMSYLYRALVVSVRDYVRKSGFADVVVGLSGGIDSALVAAIAADALGPEHVLGVLMPGPYSSAHSVDDSLELAARLGMPTRTVPITGLCDASLPLVEAALGEPLAGLPLENLQARLRGLLLMTISNARNALVLNTGNKAESGMGYSTLYGDTVGAYAPLTDVFKGTVYRLATWRNSRGPLPVIPQNIIDKPPSAELAPSQTDEASFGASYDEVDAILSMHAERGLDAQDIANAGFDPAVVERVLRSCAVAEYKRRQEPFGPVVSLRPFVDRCWPVVLGWRDRVREEAPAEPGTPGAWSIEPADPRMFDDAADLLGDIAADELRDDSAEAAAGDRPQIDDVLDGMLVRSAHQDHVAGVVSDVALSAFFSGRGPDLDDLMGVPLFSKN